MAQIHVHGSEQRVPQKPGIRGRRRTRDGASARDVGVASSLPCVIYSAVKHASPEPTLNQEILAVSACAKPWFASAEPPSAPNRNPVFSPEPTIWTLLQFLETDHAHASENSLGLQPGHRSVHTYEEQPGSRRHRGVFLCTGDLLRVHVHRDVNPLWTRNESVSRK